jgi:hypothetical protein
MRRGVRCAIAVPLFACWADCGHNCVPAAQPFADSAAGRQSAKPFADACPSYRIGPRWFHRNPIVRGCVDAHLGRGAEPSKGVPEPRERLAYQAVSAVAVSTLGLIGPGRRGQETSRSAHRPCHCVVAHYGLWGRFAARVHAWRRHARAGRDGQYGNSVPILRQPDALRPLNTVLIERASGEMRVIIDACVDCCAKFKTIWQQRRRRPPKLASSQATISSLATVRTAAEASGASCSMACSLGHGTRGHGCGSLRCMQDWRP